MFKPRMCLFPALFDLLARPTPRGRLDERPDRLRLRAPAAGRVAFWFVVTGGASAFMLMSLGVSGTIRGGRNLMTQVSARLPDELVAHVDEAARRLNRSRAEIIRQALEYYLDDVEDLRLALERLQDPADPVLDWGDVRCGLLASD